MKIPKWLRRKTVEERAQLQLEDDERALYDLENKLELMTFERALYEARRIRLTKKTVKSATPVVLFRP